MPQLDSAIDTTLDQVASQRTREMYALYANGATLEEVGNRFGLTRERVRQIFREAGMSIRTMRETIALRNGRLVRQHGEEIRAAFLVSKDIGVVAQQLDLPRVVVREAVKDLLSSVVEPHQPRKVPQPMYSTEELLAFLKEAATATSEPLSVGVYRRYAASREAEDLRHWPSEYTYAKRFGSWRKALVQAGLEAGSRLGVSRRKFSDQDCVEALRAAAATLEMPFTMAAYRDLARASAGALPSEMTIRNRFGTWPEALERARLL